MKLPAALFVVLAIAVSTTVGKSGANFVAASANPSQTFASAADFNTVAVSLADPGSPLARSVTLSASATSDRGIASVTFEVAPSGGGSWTTICTATVAPYSCGWDTTGGSDGLKDVRATALDAAGYSRSAVVSSRRVDNTAPSTALSDPGSPLRGTVTVSGGATDAGGGVANVAVQVRPSGGGAWSTICAVASCSWDTTGVADGLYDLRLAATDTAGNTGSTTVTSRRVDNTAPSVSPTDPGTPLRGPVTLRSTSADAGSGVASVRYEYRTSPSGNWTTACTAATSPFSCSWSTSGVADGVYDLRAIATDAAGNATTSTAVSSRRIDNTAPTGVSLTDPGSPLTAGVTLSGGAGDAGSGVASVRFQYAPAGTTSWTDACTSTSSPYGCTWTTTGVSDGLYDLRALATDNAGNTTTSTTVANRRVDNTGPAVTLTDPGQYLRGAVTIAAGASDPVGVQSVAIQYRSSPGGSWNTICTDTTSPYSCAWTTTGVADGSYDLQAVGTDTLGHPATSSILSTRRVDNTAPNAVDVQGANGGTAGKLDAGDTLTFTYSEAISPASILTGWTGSATAIQVKVSNSGNKDLLAVWDSAGTTRVNLTSSTQDLQLNTNWLGSSSPGVFNGTMVQSGSQIVVTFGAALSGTISTGVTGTTPMVWTPSTSATDLAGNAGSSTAVTESGVADVDF